MKRLLFPHQLLAGLACAGMIATPSISSNVSAAPTMIRSANTRAQVPDPPLPPVPVPLSGDLPPAPPPPYRDPLPNGPQPQVPPDDPGGSRYSVPFGTIRETPPPPKLYPGDPGGFGSQRQLVPNNVVPINPYQPQPVVDPNGMPPEGPLTDRFGVAPPPGTLGQTYHRRSQMIDDKKHPRLGIVEVHLSENYNVSAKGLKSKWTGKVWQLESDPLLPGVPHIFEVKAEWGPEGAQQKEVRTVRLIMGRIVDLDF